MQGLWTIDMAKQQIVGLAFLAGFFLSSCYYDNEEELYPTETCDLTEITFNQDIKPIIENNCALSGCHVPGTGRVDYTRFQGLQIAVNDGRIKQRAVVQRSMPPGGPLNGCEIKKIEKWLANGALNN